MKILTIFIGCILCATLTFGQDKFLTKQGDVSFFSSSPLEDIEADNSQVLSIIDTSNGAIAISILIKSFIFEKSLMQEHFNENYMESDKFPKSIFKGQIVNFNSTSGNDKKVSIIGDITIHGVTKKIEMEGLLNKNEESISLTGNFKVKVADFGIEIPSVVANNIAKIIKVTFDLDHKPYKK